LPSLAIAKADNSNGSWAIGQSGAQYTLRVSNTGTASTSGAITVSDKTLPSGLTLSATPSGTGWNCSGSSGSTVSCTSTTAIANGANGNVITVPVNIGSGTPTSIKNTAMAYGGGDLAHNDLTSAVSGSDTTTVTTPSPTAPDYTFTTIDVPGSASPDCGTHANGINNAGQVVGTFGNGTCDSGFVYSGGNYITFKVNNSSPTTPYGINNAGQIVGVVFGPYDGFNGWHGFLYSGGNYTTFSEPNAVSTWPWGINDSGQIVGCFNYTDNICTHGFIYSRGSFQTLDVPGATFTELIGINNAGQIVGTSNLGGFLYSGGRFTALKMPGASNALPMGINNAGQIVGFAGGLGTFLYSGGSFTLIGLEPTTAEALPLRINDAGQIVGTFYNNAYLEGFVATPASTPAPVRVNSKKGT